MTTIPMQRELVPAPLTGRTHELKTDAHVFSEVVAGRKLFEIRKDDRGFQCGDLLRLRATRLTGAEMAAGELLIYTGEEVTVRVIGILRGPVYGLADGWVIMSIAANPPEAQPSVGSGQSAYPNQAQAVPVAHDDRCKACIDRRDGFYGSYAPPCQVHDDDGNLRAPPAQPAQAADERTEAMCDAAYVAGARAGFNAAASTDPEALNKLIATRDGYIPVLKATRPAQAAAPVECATCKGNGMIGGPSFYAPDEGGDTCPDCNGSGERTYLSGGGPDAYDVDGPCGKCKGTGAAAPVVDGGALRTVDVSAMEKAIDDYLEDYEMRGEDEDGRDACYTPTEGDKALIKDAIFGLMEDDAWKAATSTTPSERPADKPVLLTDEHIERLFYPLSNATADQLFIARSIGRAIESASLAKQVKP